MKIKLIILFLSSLCTLISSENIESKISKGKERNYNAIDVGYKEDYGNGFDYLVTGSNKNKNFNEEAPQEQENSKYQQYQSYEKARLKFRKKQQQYYQEQFQNYEHKQKEKVHYQQSKQQQEQYNNQSINPITSTVSTVETSDINIIINNSNSVEKKTVNVREIIESNNSEMNAILTIFSKLKITVNNIFFYNYNYNNIKYLHIYIFIYLYILKIYNLFIRMILMKISI